jgi:PIN domain nuclease of toxin-antitoxin system
MKNEKLSEKYSKILKEEQNKYLSVISCWEISLLLEKDRIKIKYSFDDWIQNALTAYKIELVNLDLDASGVW